MILGSLLGQIFSPIFHAMSWLLAFYYGLVPNYVVAIAFLTVTVMIVSFPLNRAATRSMFKMQLLAPEMQKIRNKYKAGRDVSALERQEMRQKMNEETMALYRENNVSMLGGCLPNLAVFPIFIVLYQVVRGLTYTCSALSTAPKVCASALALKTAKHTVPLWHPNYVYNTNSALAHNLAASNGQMRAFGINLANTVRTSQAHWYLVLPFVGFVLVAVALQFLQLRQMTRRNTSTAPAAQQMQTMQRVMPLIMAVIYISIPAAVVVYFVASSLFRIGQQEWMYRRDPQITTAMKELQNRKSNPAALKSTAARPSEKAATDRPPPRSLRERLALAIAPPEPAEASDDAKSSASGNGKPAGARTGAGSSSRPAGGQKPRGNRPPGQSAGQSGQKPKAANTRQAPAGDSKPKPKPKSSGSPRGGSAGASAAKGAGETTPSRNGSAGTPNDSTKPGQANSSGSPSSSAQRRRQRRSG